jgi:hypothetical protein
MGEIVPFAKGNGLKIQNEPGTRKGKYCMRNAKAVIGGIISFASG